MELFLGLLSCTALPLDLGGRLRVLRTMLIHAALHGAEASCVSDLRLCRHGSAFVQGAWSGLFTLANLGVILTLLDGPVGSDPAFMLSGVGFV